MSYVRQYPAPLFVYGALRSGTTLLRLMLKHHPQIHSPGEADYLLDHISKTPSGDWQVDREGLADDWMFHEAGLSLPDPALTGADVIYALIDQLSARGSGMASLNMHRNISILAELFPEAKFIHLLRDPRDVARSSVQMGWNGNSYFGVRHWIETEADWDAVGVPADRALDVRFEDLMQDLEAGLGRICDFAGLEFAPEMLDYYKNSTYGPPDPDIAQKWRKKADPREIARIDGLAGALMEARGYALAGTPVTPGALEEVGLRIDNTLNRWRFNIRRYGFGLFASHHIARLLRIKPLADRLAMRKQVIKIQNLK